MKRLLLTIMLSVLCSIGFSHDIIDPVLHNVLNERNDEMIRINIILKSQIDIEMLNDRGSNINDKQLRLLSSSKNSKTSQKRNKKT